MAKTAKTMQRHPLSEMFSLPISPEEREALRAHIKTNSQLHPILTYEGMVLDGWERYTACLEVGVTPEFKKYEGPNPASAAFGANVLRRRLSSVQKALMAARFLIQQQEAGETIRQKDAAAMACVSLKRLNEMVQLIRKADGDENAAKALAKISGTSEMTGPACQALLADAGIIDTAVKPASSAGADSDSDDDDEDLGDPDAGVDLLTGSSDVDELLDEAGVGSTAKRKNRAFDDDDTDPLPAVGARRVDANKRASETPASVLSKQYRALTEPERRDFVRFAWSVLRADVEALAKEGRIELPAIGANVDPGTSTLADMARTLTGAPITAETLPAAKPARKSRKPATHDI